MQFTLIYHPTMLSYHSSSPKHDVFILPSNSQQYSVHTSILLPVILYYTYLFACQSSLLDSALLKGKDCLSHYYCSRVDQKCHITGMQIMLHIWKNKCVLPSTMILSLLSIIIRIYSLTAESLLVYLKANLKIKI